MVYAISHVSVKDDDLYHRFWSRFEKVIIRYEGQILSADAHPGLIEGAWEEDIVLLLSFPSKAAFEAWQNSLECKKLINDKQQSASFSTILAEEYLPPTIDLQYGRQSQDNKYYFRAHEILQIAFCTCLSLMFVLFSFMAAHSGEISLKQAVSNVDWQIAVLLTAIFMMVVNAFERRKYL
ncbi:MAG: hypothetical protein DHS20C05_20920 [Hyphococcus sp.]|nr:MAG: hypothetical protein DHS20C05_20920 [Marinicaulis sp.]